MKKIGIIILILAIILIICGGVRVFLGITSDDAMIYSQDITDKKYNNVSMCYTEENCDLDTMKFKLLRSNFQNKKVSSFIKKVNDDTKSYYQIVQSSLTNENPSCLQFKDTYKYSAYIQNDYQIFSNDHFLSVAVNRELKDICTNESETLPYEVIVYDKDEKRVLSQDELLKVIGYSKANVMSIIRDSVSDEMATGASSVEDLDYQYSVFFDNVGEVILAFRVDNQNKTNYKKITIG